MNHVVLPMRVPFIHRLVAPLLLWAALSGHPAGAAHPEVNFSASPEVSGTADGGQRIPKQQARMALNYVNQPPLIPHSVEGYQVTTQTNRCLQCHGVTGYRATGAPRISPTHFVDSDGNVLGGVAPRRYFCLQCHVPQTESPAIVENTFSPSRGFGN